MTTLTSQRLQQIKRESEIEYAKREQARRDTTMQARRAKRRAMDAETLQTLDRVREAWRRLEAQGDPLGLKNGAHRLPAQSLGEPTPERKAKANGVGEKVIGKRVVRKLLTTADNLALEPRTKACHLPKHLRAALDQFAVAVAEAMNVNVVDEKQQASAGMVSRAYDGSLPGAYGPRGIPDRVLDARYLWKCLEREIPLEMIEVLDQLVGEETGLLQGKPAPLQTYGNRYGWKDERQAYAAGGMHAIDACAVLHHAIKRGVGRRKT